MFSHKSKIWEELLHEMRVQGLTAARESDKLGKCHSKVAYIHRKALSMLLKRVSENVSLHGMDSPFEIIRLTAHLIHDLICYESMSTSHRLFKKSKNSLSLSYFCFPSLIGL